MSIITPSLAIGIPTARRKEVAVAETPILRGKVIDVTSEPGNGAAKIVASSGKSYVRSVPQPPR